jgi:hypothetical protein
MKVIQFKEASSLSSMKWELGFKKFEKYLELRVLQIPQKKIQNHIGGSIKPKIITKSFFQNQEPNNTNINCEHMSIKNVTSLIP